MIQQALNFSLEISSVRIKDFGEYMVIVENGVGDPLQFLFLLRPIGMWIFVFI